MYYARLRWHGETYYKLGFTTSASVEDRFRFAGDTDHALIDRVLLFCPDPTAYEIEGRLHSHYEKFRVFGPFARFRDGPLKGNGQSELYAVDILGMDEEFTPSQGWRAQLQALRIRLMPRVRWLLNPDKPADKAVWVLNSILLAPALAIWLIHDRLSPAKRQRREKQAQHWAIANTDIQAQIARLRAGNRIA